MSSKQLFAFCISLEDSSDTFFVLNVGDNRENVNAFSVSSHSGVFSLRATASALQLPCVIRTVIMSNHLCYIRLTSTASSEQVSSS